MKKVGLTPTPRTRDLSSPKALEKKAQPDAVVSLNATQRAELGSKTVEADTEVIGLDPSTKMGATGGVDAGTSPLQTFLGAKLERAESGVLWQGDIQELNEVLDAVSDGELRGLGAQLSESLTTLSSLVSEASTTERDRETTREISGMGMLGTIFGVGAAELTKLAFKHSAHNVDKLLGVAATGAFGLLGAGAEMIGLMRTVGQVLEGNEGKTSTDVLFAAAKLGTSIASYVNPLFLIARVGLEIADGQRLKRKAAKEDAGPLPEMLDAADAKARALIDELVAKVARPVAA